MSDFSCNSEKSDNVKELELCLDSINISNEKINNEYETPTKKGISKINDFQEEKLKKKKNFIAEGINVSCFNMHLDKYELQENGIENKMLEFL